LVDWVPGAISIRRKGRKSAEHHAHPDLRFVAAVQGKRLAIRNERGEEVATPEA
jgi:hypothetical protein